MKKCFEGKEDEGQKWLTGSHSKTQFHQSWSLKGWWLMNDGLFKDKVRDMGSVNTPPNDDEGAWHQFNHKTTLQKSFFFQDSFWCSLPWQAAILLLPLVSMNRIGFVYSLFLCVAQQISPMPTSTMYRHAIHSCALIWIYVYLFFLLPL